MASLAVPNGGAAPGTHALVIGVSSYPFADGPNATPVGEEFEIENLTSAARSASEIAAWLLNEYRNEERPLASLRVLLSPSEGETLHPTIEQLLPGEAQATRAAVESELGAFRQACRTNPANAGVVYIAGHGVQVHKRGAVVLLNDFGDPSHVNELAGAIDVAGCHDGMDEGGSADEQFWFVDACRQRPAVARRFERLEGALTLGERTGHVGSSPLFLAASTRGTAAAERGGTSLFNQAVLWALRGAGAVGPDELSDEWYVSVTSLIRLLASEIERLADSHGEEQTFDLDGRPLEAVVHRFQTPPDVDVVLSLRPTAATHATRGCLLLNGRDRVFEWDTWPFQEQVEPGIYALEITPHPPFRTPDPELLTVTHPRFAFEVEVA